MYNFKTFFKNKRILITGNTGFVGSNLSLALSLFGAKVLGLSEKKAYRGYISNHNGYKKKIKTIQTDILKVQKKYKLIKKFKPQIIIHLASQPIVRESFINTKKTYETNVLGTVELFETLKKVTTVKQIVIFTSDKVYQNIDGKYLNEFSKIGGLDPYSASKSSQDIIANSYKESFFKTQKNVSIIRAGNIIGGGDFDFSRIIPELVLSLRKNKILKLRNPNAIRPWQHILDVLNAIMIIVSKNYKRINPKSIIFNIGPDIKSNIRVVDLIVKIKKRFKKLKFKKMNKINFIESKVLKLSNQHLKKSTMWKPVLDIHSSINLTLDWYEEYYKNSKNILEFTENQIKKFFRI
tara:strand:- start:1165 stop:2217 length:1053 start_codon:yes stop_codon:yes gene_type:complete